MKRKLILLLLVIALITGGALVAVSNSKAQTSTNYGLEWHILSGAVGEMCSTSFCLNSTLGQTMAGEFSSTNYNLWAGYWQKLTYRVYLPLVLRNYD